MSQQSQSQSANDAQTPSLLSGTYQLPADLEVKHYRKYQTCITSTTTSSNDRNRIEKVRETLISTVADKTSAIGETTSILDADDDLTAQMSKLAITTSPSPLPDQTQLMTAAREGELMQRYGKEVTAAEIKPRTLHLNTPIAFNWDPTKPKLVLNKELKLGAEGVADGDWEDEQQQQPSSSSSAAASNLTPTTTKYNLFPPRTQAKISNFINAIHAIGEAKNIIVVMGAGLSVAAGVPDFRSDNGLYNLLNGVDLFGGGGFKLDPKKFPPQQIAQSMKTFNPHDLFSLPTFRLNPIPFYTFYYKMGIAGDVCKPTFAHRFIKLLEEKGKLRRVYTQNIDNLESKAGIKNYVACHGNDQQFYCLGCGLEVPTTFLEPWLAKKQIPFCAELRHFLYQTYYTTATALESQGFDTTSPNSKVPFSSAQLIDHYQGNKTRRNCDELWKPRIVFFGENLPPSFFSSLRSDMGQCDLVLVMGTSLQVSPVADLPHELSDERGVLGISTATSQLSRSGADCRPFQQYVVDPKLSGANERGNLTMGSPMVHLEGTTPNNSNLPPQSQLLNAAASCARQLTMFNFALDKYPHYLARHNVDTIHLDMITRNLKHVPIMAINRDSLLPLSTLYPKSTSRPGNKSPKKGSSSGGSEYSPQSHCTEQAMENLAQQLYSRVKGVNDNGENPPQFTFTPIAYNGELLPTLTRNDIIGGDGDDDNDDGYDDLSDGEYDDWVKSIEGNNNEPKKNPYQTPNINSMPCMYLNRLDYEFLGNADDVTQFMVKALGW